MKKWMIIKAGWEDAGTLVEVLGEPIMFGGQEWLPCRLEEEEDPTFHKLDGLRALPD